MAIEMTSQEPRLLPFKKLGFLRHSILKVEKSVKKEKGGILVSGGFNSGKTTTLYSLINFINRPEINISTIEKEILYDISFINQSLLNIKKGFDYPFAFSSILRQDSDVIMIDEINNKDSIEAFLNIAEKGYLAVAGIYSKNILTCLDFFRALAISPSLFFKSVNLFIAQELLLKNCPHCLSKQTVDEETRLKIENKINVKQLFERAVNKKIISQKIKTLADVKFYKSLGCDRCRKTRKRDFIASFEILEITDKIKNLAKEGHLSKIRQEIKNQDEFFIEEDALLKAVNGIVSIEAVLKLLNNQ